LSEDDTISMNGDRLIADAKKEVLAARSCENQA